MHSGREEDWYDQGYLDAGQDVDAFDNNQSFMVNRMHQRSHDNGSRTFLPREIWDKLPEESKNIIRGIGLTKSATTRKVNIHDMVAIDYDDTSPNIVYNANNMELTSDLADDDPAPTENSDNVEDSCAILAHITKQQLLLAGHDIRSVLASAHDRGKCGVAAPVNMKSPPFGTAQASGKDTSSTASKTSKRIRTESNTASRLNILEKVQKLHL
jgi:hypothetical protein